MSIRQPWASLIVIGGIDVHTGATTLKDIENRTWATAYRGPVLIHASQRPDAIRPEEIERRFGVRVPSDLPLGGVIGMTEIIACARPHASRWYAPGGYGFVLANSRSLPFVPWKGALSLRNAPADLLKLCGLLSEQDESSDALAATAA
jgi:hypothetical protein